MATLEITGQLHIQRMVIKKRLKKVRLKTKTRPPIAQNSEDEEEEEEPQQLAPTTTASSSSSIKPRFTRKNMTKGKAIKRQGLLEAIK